MKLSRYIFSIISFISFLLTASSAMAKDIRFLHINCENGLPNQEVETLAEDNEGYIWIGTRNGLCKYDGYTVTTYYHDKKQKSSLLNNFVHNIYTDKNGNVWVGTEIGLCRYRRPSDDFKSYPGSTSYCRMVTENSLGVIFAGGSKLYKYNAKKDIIERIAAPNYGPIKSICADKTGRLYVATSKVVYCYNPQLTKATILLSQKEVKGFKKKLNDEIIPIAIDSYNRLWIGRNGQGVMWIDTRNGKKHIYTSKEISNGIVRCITEDYQHNIWIGTEGGVSTIAPDGTISKFQHQLNNTNSLSDNAIYSILCDRNSNIWIGSYFGGVDIAMHNSLAFKWTRPGFLSENLTAGVVRGMAEVSPGIFWIALENGGINIYNSYTGILSPPHDASIAGTNVHSLLYEPDKKRMWIGTRFNGLACYNLTSNSFTWYFLKKGLDSEGIFYICRQRNGRIWLATMKGLRYYDEKHDVFRAINNPTLKNSFIYTIYTDRADNVWVGTIAYGIYVINGKTNKIAHFSQVHNGLEDNYIISLFQDSKGRMWIGTNNNGLQYYDARRNTFVQVFDDVLGNKTICSINEDLKGNLWISTNQGLYKLDVDRKNLNSFSYDNGLPVIQFNLNSSLRAQNGTMLFGTINGLISFNPSQMAFMWPRCVVHLKNLVINNVAIHCNSKDSPLKCELDSTEKLVLNYSKSRSFSIEYGVIMPGQTDGIEYQIMGMDDKWRNVGNDRVFHGYNLSPGTYHLKIRARHIGQDWNENPVKELIIVIKPPFYRTFYAYLLYILIISIAVYYLRKQMKTRQEEKNAVRIATLEKEKLEELDKEKFNFFTTMSHELKTPLSLIIAPLKTIAANNLDETSKRGLDIALNNSYKMKLLIDELMTFNKLTDNTFPLYLQKGNPMSFIKKLTRAHALSAHEKQLKLFVECVDDDEEVWFSPNYVERILNNLISNAFKFTPAGGKVTIHASIQKDSSDGYNYLQMDVSDTGIGIKDTEINKIFNRYYQTKRGYYTDGSGWGIGLSTVKMLATKHKGTVSVKSVVGEGATFTVRLNVTKSAFTPENFLDDSKAMLSIDDYKFMAQPVMTNHDEEIDTEEDAEKNTILIVDDNKDLREYLSMLFKKEYNIYTSVNGLQALEITKEKKIDLIISDVMMPEMDGYELCDRLKSDIHSSHIPIILLTAKSKDNDKIAGFKHGADAFVAKPFEPESLKLQVKNMLNLIKRRQDEIVRSDEDKLDTVEINELDKEFINKINAIVDKNIDNSDFSVTDITQEIGMSRSLLHIKMKALMGISIGNFIHKKRIELACKLLLQGYNVTETAYRTGFSNNNYFSKSFKKELGCTPTEYVKSKKSNSQKQ